MYFLNLLIAIGLSAGAKSKSSFQKPSGLYSLVSSHRYRLPYGRLIFPNDQMSGIHIHVDYMAPSASGNTLAISRLTRPLGWPQEVPFCDTALPHAFNQYLEKSKVDFDDFSQIQFPFFPRVNACLQECVCRIKFALSLGYAPYGEDSMTEESAVSYCEARITSFADTATIFARVSSIPKQDAGSASPLSDTIKNLIPDMVLDIIKIRKGQWPILRGVVARVNGMPPSYFGNLCFKNDVGAILAMFTGTEELQNVLQIYDGHSDYNWWVYGGQASTELDLSGNDWWYGRPVNALYEYTDEVKYQLEGFGTATMSVEPSNYLGISQFEYGEPEYTSCSALFASIIRKALRSSSISALESVMLNLVILNSIRFIEELRCVLKASLLFGFGDLQITGVHVRTFETEADIDQWIKEKFRIHYNVHSRHYMPTIRLFRSGVSVIDQISQHQNSPIEISRTPVLLHQTKSLTEEFRRILAGELSVVDAVRNKYAEIEQHPRFANALTHQFQLVSQWLNDAHEQVIAGKYRRAVTRQDPANNVSHSRGRRHA